MPVYFSKMLLLIVSQKILLFVLQVVTTVSKALCAASQVI